jgi:hypothetical protein
MLRNWLRFVVSLALGCVIGAIAHYALYRISLPVEPFIYLAF